MMYIVGMVKGHLMTNIVGMVKGHLMIVGVVDVI